MKVLMYDDTEREAFWRGSSLYVWLTDDKYISLLLGRIRKKNDGRWNWFYNPDKNNYIKEIEPTKAQGTCSTEEEAKLTLENLWAYK